MSEAYTGLAQSLRTMMRVGENTASNIARTQVDGARETRISVSAPATDIGGNGAGGSALSITGMSTDTRQGALASSDSPTDLALAGGGYFLLFDQSGNLFMSRNGKFNFNSAGELVNGQGLNVASFDPGTNMINKTTKATVSGSWTNDDHIAFNGDGQLVNLSQGNTPGRQLALARVPNEGALVNSPTYPGMFSASEATGMIQTGRAGETDLGVIVPNAIEQSNISLPDQMVNLATFKGGFTATAAALRVLNSALDDIINQFRPA